MGVPRDTIGLRINFTVTGLDISAANGAITFEARKPVSGDALSWTSITIDDGPNGLCHYDTVAGDLDEPGVMRIQGKWVPISTSNQFFTSVVELEIDERALA